MMESILAKVKRGIVLAELGGYANGYFCAKHGAGASLVIMGTYIISREPADAIPYAEEFVFKPGRENFEDYLKEHIAEAKKSGALVCPSVISTNLQDCIDFMQTAEELGADLVSLCAHSVKQMFIAKGLGDAMRMRINHHILENWANSLRESVSLPMIFKMRLGEPEETLDGVKILDRCGIEAVHLNCGMLENGLEGLPSFKDSCSLLIAGGGVWDIHGVLKLLGAGADAVSIGRAAIEDASLCGELQKKLLNNSFS